MQGTGKQKEQAIELSSPSAAYFGLSGQRFRHHSDKRSGVVRTS